MKANPPRPRKTEDLRARAEGSLRTKGKRPARPSGDDIQRTVHELQVHEIELQIQNEELRRVQQELEEACERYAHLYDFAPCAYLTLGPKGEISEANLAAAHLLGMERKNLIKQNFSRFILEESQDDFYLYGRLTLASGIRQTNRLELKSASGARSVVRIDGIAEDCAGDGEPRYRVSLTDITDSRRAEETVQLSEKNLSDFFEDAPIGLQWLGIDGTILRANRAQLEMLGYDREQYAGRRFAEFDLDQKAADELICRLAAGETIHHFRTRLKQKDGGIRFVLMDAKSHWNGKQFIHSSIFTRDITMRVELEQELLQISEREHRRIAQDLHDDLGQILTATIHLSTALQKRLAEKALPEAADEARILALLAQALSQTRSMARGLHPVRPEPNALMAALEELAARTEMLFHFPCRFKHGRPVLIEDNNVATHLYRIAQEAVTNAVRHGKPRRIAIRLDQVANRIRVAVTDDGVGLPHPQPKNAGMGLRIMRYRTGMIGGTLAIRRMRRGGTEVLCSVQAAKPLSGKPKRHENQGLERTREENPNRR
jgi:PAS domain S-box-containing protein